MAHRLPALAWLMVTGVAVAQTTPFEVASIKPSKDLSNETYVMQDQSGNLTGHNATLKALIRTAYAVRDHQILGGPAWMDSERFEVLAKPHVRAATSAEFRQMAQALLSDRFGLQLHRETRELPVFALTVGRNGPRLVEWRQAVGPACGYMAGRLTCTKVTMAILADSLARRLGRSVIDKTGLLGTYDLTLEWTPDENQVPGPAENGKAQARDSGGPSLFSAIQEQIGLKLETAKAPVETLVIDDAHKPSEND